MKIIFLGIMFCDEALKHVYKDSLHGVSMAPHIFQTNLLSGFESLNDVVVELSISTTEVSDKQQKLYSSVLWKKQSSNRIFEFTRIMECA